MTWRSTPERNAKLQSLLADFHANTPAITVTLTLLDNYEEELPLLLTSASPTDTNMLPDLVLVDGWRFPDLMQAKLLQPIGDQLDNPSDFYPVLRTMFSRKGAFVCAPREVNTLGLFYNTRWFDKKEYAYPTPSWSWTELRAAAEALTDPNAAITGLALNPDFSRWLALFYQNGGSVLDATGTKMTFNTAQNLETVQFFDEMESNGWMHDASELDGTWIGESFGKQRAALAIEGNWAVPYLKTAFADLSFAVAELPHGSQPAVDNRATIAFSSCYAVPTHAPHPAEAIALANYLTGDPAMRAWTKDGSTLPARASLRADFLQQHPDLQAFLDGMAYARGWQIAPGFQTALGRINAKLLALYDGNTTHEGFLETVEREGNEALAR